MSTAITKRDLRAALADADAFRALFAGTYHRWEFAGSCRRGKPEVGDVEHVIIPCFAEVPGGDLFGAPVKVNLVMAACEDLLGHRGFSRHVYGRDEHGAPRFRWGEKHRGCDFHGFTHEIFSADAENWGSVLAIRTGPSEYSKMLVMRLRRNGYRNHLGRVWRCAICPLRVERENGRCPPSCEHCQGTGLQPITAVSVPSEQELFALAGVAWVEPDCREQVAAG